MGRLNSLRGWIATTLGRRKKQRSLVASPSGNNKKAAESQRFTPDGLYDLSGIEGKKYQKCVRCHGVSALWVNGVLALTNDRRGKPCACIVAQAHSIDAVYADNTNDAGYVSKDDNTDGEDLNAAEVKRIAETGRRSMIKTNPWIGPQTHQLAPPASPAIDSDGAHGDWNAEQMSDVSSSDSEDDDGEDAYLGDSSSVTSTESDGELNVKDRRSGAAKNKRKSSDASSQNSADGAAGDKSAAPEDFDLSMNDSGFESNTCTQQSGTEPGTPVDNCSLGSAQAQTPTGETATLELEGTHRPQSEKFTQNENLREDFAAESLYTQASTLQLPRGRLSLPSSTLQLYSARQYAGSSRSVWRCASTSGPVYQSNSSLASKESLRREMRLQEDLEEKVRNLSDVQRLLELQLKTNSLKAVSQPAMDYHMAADRHHQPSFDRHRQWKDDIIQFRCQLMLYRKQRLLMTLQCLRDQLDRETKRLEQSYMNSVFLQDQWWQALHTARESLV
ncbi:PREDICTED: uncharacterized protein LOC106807597 [Priapulus caudatus]|uniref:Uncharacterized protein LOC106807597 n=1 Tax=Priapulus caudatus TaxID=37621 RepID=A0ABM1DZV7_PRICU|nr:PREDICTED: uncharacterized protein LOC106807597 [Priapulus caudatus]